MRALQTLLSVIETSAPVLPRSSVPEVRTLTQAYWGTHEFPSVRTPSPSRNISWLRTVLARSLPPPLLAKFSFSQRDPTWDKTVEARAVSQLICCTGFLPIRELHEERTGRLSSSSASITPSVSRASITGISDLEMNVQEQSTRARLRAREVAYDMLYLTRRRHWGPYMPVETAVLPGVYNSGASTSHSTSRSEQTVEGSYQVSTEATVGLGTYSDSDTDSDADPDFVPTTTEDNASLSSHSSFGRSPSPDSNAGAPPLPETLAVQPRRRLVPRAESAEDIYRDLRLPAVPENRGEQKKTQSEVEVYPSMHGGSSSAVQTSLTQTSWHILVRHRPSRRR